MIAPGLHLIATGGYDSNNYISLGGSTKGNFWQGGFAWNASELTSLSAAVGHRYYGDTYTLNAATRGHLTTLESQLHQCGYHQPIPIRPARSQQYRRDVESVAVGVDLGSDPARASGQRTLFKAPGCPLCWPAPPTILRIPCFCKSNCRHPIAYNTPKNTLLFSLFDSSSEPLSAVQVQLPIVAEPKHQAVGRQCHVRPEIFRQRLAQR